MKLTDQQRAKCQKLAAMWPKYAMFNGDLVTALLADLEEAGSEITRLRQGLWDCFAAAGGDTDGDPTPVALVSDIVPLALECVRELRADLEEAEVKLAASEQARQDDRRQVATANARIAELERVQEMLVVALKKYQASESLEQLRDAAIRAESAIAAAQKPASAEPADDCRRCTGTGLIEDPATPLHAGGNGFMPCPDCQPISAGFARGLIVDEPELTVSAHKLASVPTIPPGWVALRLEWEPGYPEDVAFGPKIMMDRLGKWLGEHMARKVADAAQKPATCEKCNSPDLCKEYGRACEHGETQDPAAISAAATDVLAERRRQIEVEGWTPEHDDEHDDGSLAAAAACYALGEQAGEIPAGWPQSWDESWWRPSADERRNLVKAGALIIAEIERLDRATQKPTGICCADGCDWSGALSDCVMCGAIGPLCPECHEVVEPDAAQKPNEAKSEITDIALLKAYSRANNGKQLVSQDRSLFLRHARIALSAKPD